MYLKVSKELVSLAGMISVKSSIKDINEELKKNPALNKQLSKLLGIKMADEEVEAGAASKAVAFMALLQLLMGAVPSFSQDLKKFVTEEDTVSIEAPSADKTVLQPKIKQIVFKNETDREAIKQLESYIKATKGDAAKKRTCTSMITQALKSGLIDQEEANNYLASIGIGFSA